MAQLQEQWLNEELSLKTIFVLHMKEDDFQMKEKILSRDQRTLKTIYVLSTWKLSDDSVSSYHLYNQKSEHDYSIKWNWRQKTHLKDNTSKKAAASDAMWTEDMTLRLFTGFPRGTEPLPDPWILHRYTLFSHFSLHPTSTEQGANGAS